MKSLPFAVVLCAVMPILLVAGSCSKEDEPATTNPPGTNVGGTAPPEQVTEAPTEQATQAPNQAIAAPGAVAEFAHVRVYLNAIQDPWTSDNIYIKPAAGKRFVSFDTTIEFFNESDTHRANPFNFGLSDSESFAYDPTFSGPDPSLNAVELRPGEKTRGWITFEVNEGTPLQPLRYRPNILKDSYIEFNFQ